MMHYGGKGFSKPILTWDPITFPDSNLFSIPSNLVDIGFYKFEGNSESFSKSKIFFFFINSFPNGFFFFFYSTWALRNFEHNRVSINKTDLNLQIVQLFAFF